MRNIRDHPQSFVDFVHWGGIQHNSFPFRILPNEFLPCLIRIHIWGPTRRFNLWNFGFFFINPPLFTFNFNMALIYSRNKSLCGPEFVHCSWGQCQNCRDFMSTFLYPKTHFIKIENGVAQFECHLNVLMGECSNPSPFLIRMWASLLILCVRTTGTKREYQ